MKRLIATVATAVVAGMIVVSAAQSAVQPSDTAAYYKAKCLMCHGKKAEKKFNTSLTDDQLLEIVLKGKKAAKPPHMPAYAEKGVTAEHAKALIEHMKQLKAAP
ncbi:MAG TPA: cytochrome c [Pyrinomonadaceae bacterium]|nr:cytochrome c [Pyrinomonadaceae bacterium]